MFASTPGKILLQQTARSQATCRHATRDMNAMRQRFRLSQPLTPSSMRHMSQQRQSPFRGMLERTRQAYRKNPITFGLAVTCIAFGVGTLIYTSYVYQYYIIGAYSRYPEEVAKKLRRAIFYTNYELNPKEALKYYQQAVQVANDLGMDPFSDEVMGIKIQVAFFMEKIQYLDKAIEVLERIRIDNLAWLQRFGEAPDRKKQRTHILAKTVAINTKLGDLYADPSIWNRDMAQERLVWAVETVLKERQRRVSEHVSEEDEGPWMSNSEIGAALESLAHAYEAKDQHYLATPLLIQALSLYPNTDCHTVILMNNLASSLAQQTPEAAQTAQAHAASSTIRSDFLPVGPITRETLVENAVTWGTKALDVAAGIQPPDRTDECDLGCAVATHNLGEFAEMARDWDTAKRRYTEAISLARAAGFEEGLENSSARLRALDEKI